MEKGGVLYKSEAHLQSLCTKWFSREYIEQWEKGRLFLIYNNPPSARMGAILKSMGLRSGASDQVYFCETNKNLFWLEYKIDGRQQSEEQELFEKMVEDWNQYYFIIRNENDFITLINRLNGK